MSSEQTDGEAPNETIAGNGQPLVRVKRLTGKQRSAERAAQPPPPPAPVMPGGTRIYSPGDEVPPEVDDPSYRDGPTIGEIRLTDAARSSGSLAPEPRRAEVEDSSDDRLRTLEDIYARFPIDETGQYYVHIERKAPHVYHGVSTRGVLRRMTQPLGFEEFVEVYGGGDYMLIVYGPPLRGRVIDESTGLPRAKALTEPIRFVIPWHEQGGYPPNLEAALQEDDAMLQSRMPRNIEEMVMTRGVRSPADAKIFEHHVMANERKDQRERQDQQHAEQRQAMADATTVSVLQQAWDRDREALTSQINELKRDIRESKRGGGDIESVTRLVEATGKGRATSEEISQLKDQHGREIERLVLTNKQDMVNLEARASQERAADKHEREAMSNRCEARIKVVEELQQRRQTELEERFDRERARSAEERTALENRLTAEHRRELESTRNEYERRLSSQKEQYELRISDERRQAERDLTMRKELTAAEIKSESSSQQVKLDAANRDIKRKDEEIAKLRSDLDKRPNLSKMIEDAEGTAELLGYVKPDANEGSSEKKDWKGQLLEISTEAFKNMPQIIESASKAIGARRAPAAPPPQAYPEMGMGMQQLPPRAPVTMAPPLQSFQSELSGVEAPAPPGEMFQGYSYPSVAPPPMPQQRPAPPPMPQIAQPPVPPQAMVPASAMQYAQPANQQQPALPSPSVAPQAQASVAPPAPQQVGDVAQGQILAALPQLEAAFNADMPPSNLAAEILRQVGPLQARIILDLVSPDVVAQVLASRGITTSPFVRRNGQKYLGMTQAHLIELLKAA